MARHFGLKARASPPRTSKANDLEGKQDMGGKHGEQAGMPKSPKRPRTTERDNDVAPKQSERKPGR